MVCNVSNFITFQNDMSRDEALPVIGPVVVSPARFVFSTMESATGLTCCFTCMLTDMCFKACKEAGNPDRDDDEIILENTCCFENSDNCSDHALLGLRGMLTSALNVFTLGIPRYRLERPYFLLDAMEKQRYRLAKFFINNREAFNINPNQANAWGKNALMLAAGTDNNKMIELLIGITNLDAKDKAGNTVFDLGLSKRNPIYMLYIESIYKQALEETIPIAKRDISKIIVEYVDPAKRAPVAPGVVCI